MPIAMSLEFGPLERIELPAVPPLLPATLTDHRPEGAKIIVVSCNPDDRGGIIYTIDPDNASLFLGGLIRAIDSDVGEIEKVLAQDEEYRRILHTNTKRGAGTLCLKHFDL